MGKKSGNFKQNKFKLISLLVLLVIIIISSLSIYQDLAHEDNKILNDKLENPTGRATTGLYVINTEENKEGEK